MNLSDRLTLDMFLLATQHIQHNINKFGRKTAEEIAYSQLNLIVAAPIEYKEALLTAFGG